MLKKIITKSFKETQKLGLDFARVIARSEATKQSKAAVVIALHGNLGGGKTTFLQGFAKGLGIKEKILSPTFVIQKRFKIPPIVKSTLSRDFYDGCFYHFDCYRINKPEEILELGFKEIIHPPAGGPKNIVAIEWPKKIKKYLPKDTIKIDFKFIDENKREIKINKENFEISLAMEAILSGERDLKAGRTRTSQKFFKSLNKKRNKF